MKTNVIMALGLSWLLSAATTPALGMDRWAALSMIKSGNNGTDIGLAVEVESVLNQTLAGGKLWRSLAPCRPHQSTVRVARGVNHYARVKRAV